MAATGHEDRFRRLFADESRTRLTRLSEQLLTLEESPADAELLASLFREAHTLKGGAAVVGLPAVTRIAHGLEDVLDALRSGTVVTSDVVDVLLRAVDTLRELIAAGVEGREPSEDVQASEAALRALLDAPSPIPQDAPETPGESAQRQAGAPEAERRREDTVRVSLARLDELARLVTEAATAQLRVGALLARELGVQPDDLPEFRELGRVLDELQDRATRARMVPVSTIVEPLRRAVRDLSRALDKDVVWEARGADTEVDRAVLEHIADPLLQLVRNAVDHGVEPREERAAAGKARTGVVRLHAMRLGAEVVLAVSDDGRGIDAEKVAEAARRRGLDLSGRDDEELRYAIFTTGLSTAATVSDVSGRGVGLDVVRAALDRVRGRVEVRTEPGAGTEFRLIVPMTLSVLPCVLVQTQRQHYALPLHAVMSGVDIARSGESLEGREVLRVDGRHVGVSDLAQVLGLREHSNGSGPALVVGGLTRLHAFRVDAILGQRRVVVRGLGRLLPRVDFVAGASVEPDGRILIVLDPPGLIDAARRHQRVEVDARGEPGGERHRGAGARVLVVDDALTVRELQRSILERAGYQVTTAVDGEDALRLLNAEKWDLVLTDVEMPRLDGFGLVEAMRARPALAAVPVVILTSRASEDDRRRGLDAGADAYVEKSAFDAAALLSTVARLLRQGS